MQGGLSAAAFERVDVNGGPMRVARWGHGPAGVLGIHGITASLAALAPVARYLGPQTALVAPDLRGRGASARLPAPFGLRAHAEDCARVIEALLRPPVTVVGESMGGFVGVVLAATRPDLVERLVLVDGGLPFERPEDAAPDAVLSAVLGPALTRLGRVFPSHEAYLDFWRDHPAMGTTWNPDVEAYLLYDLEPTDGGFRSRVSEAAVRADGADVVCGPSDVADALTRVTCPAHLLRASRNLVDAVPPLYPEHAVAPWRAAVASLTDEVVAGTNHYSVMFGERGARLIAERATAPSAPRDVSEAGVSGAAARARAAPTTPTGAGATSASPAPTARPVLRVSGLEVVYDDVVLALRGVTMDVPEGSVVALLGANGAGKTTTLRAVTGLLPLHRGKITKGTVEARDRSVAGLDAAAIVRLGVSQVMEGRRIFAELTVDENLRAGGFTRRDRAGFKASYEHVMALFPILAGRRRSTAGYLSGGEQQMLAIGRALMQAPRLLILDEPSLGLAPIVVEQIADIIANINATGTSVLLVEQNAKMALGLAHRGYVLENGRVVKDGGGPELLADKEIQEFYLGVGEAGRRSFRDVKSYRRKKRWSA